MPANESDEFNTYVFIDVSNIRSACLKTCGFNIDFVKLYRYLQEKYEKLRDVRYYEGRSYNDLEKGEFFGTLRKVGYTVREMRRRTYTDPAILKTFECNHCGKRNRVEAMPGVKRMKSNVDVYLAAEMLEVAYEAKEPTRIVLFSCDGDYAEAIRIAAKNKKVIFNVMATPPEQDWKKNSLSIRLKKLRKELPEQYQLNNIESIRDDIKV